MAASKLVFDTREACAYVIFRRFCVSREQSLAIIDEIARQAPGLKRILSKKWRKPRRSLSGTCAKSGERNNDDYR